MYGKTSGNNRLEFDFTQSVAKIYSDDTERREI